MLGLESDWKPLLQVGSAISNLRRFDFRRHCSEMATEAMVSKFECYSNYVVEYNATDGDFQGESQKLGRHAANSHLIGRDRAYGPQRCMVY